MKKIRTFILSWDCNGLETCQDLTEHLNTANLFEKEKIFDLIRDPEATPRNETMRRVNQMVGHLMLRAQVNPQRNYEIYLLKTDRSINKQDLVSMFEDTPQSAADLIRERGTKVYSNRETKKRVIV